MMFCVCNIFSRSRDIQVTRIQLMTSEVVKVWRQITKSRIPPEILRHCNRNLTTVMYVKKDIQ